VERSQAGGTTTILFPGILHSQLFGALQVAVLFHAYTRCPDEIS
jgi:hypothetical protein